VKQQVVAEGLPAPKGPYSPGLRVGDWVFVSGQVATDPRTGRIAGSTIEEQTRQTLSNVKAILEAAGTSLDDCVKITVYLKDMGDFERFNAVYETFFADPKPTRATVQAVLVPGALIEIDAIAYRPAGKG